MSAANSVSVPVRFNEAAGIPRGRLASDRAIRPIRHASMRPRVFPAEDKGDWAVIQRIDQLQ